MALFKKEILVNPDSIASFDEVMIFSQNWLDVTFQNKPGNTDYFFADVFFPSGHATHSLQLWRIYTSACIDGKGLSPSETTGRIEWIVGDLDTVNSDLRKHNERLLSLETIEPVVTAQIV